MAFHQRGLTILAVISTLLKALEARDECAGLFFTPAWQACFQKSLQSNWAPNPLPAGNFFMNPFVFPKIPPIVMPDVGAIIENAHAEGVAHGGNSFVSSSSFSANSAHGTNVLSTNGRTWIIQSSGFPTHTTENNGIRHIQAVVGRPESISKSFGNDNSIQVDFKYKDGSTKWIKVKLESPTQAKDLTAENRNGIFYIDGHI